MIERAIRTLQYYADAAGAWVTVWRFESPSSGETAVVMRRAEPGDESYQHAYQKILYRGPYKDYRGSTGNHQES
jgi:hypothetical protein